MSRSQSSVADTAEFLVRNAVECLPAGELAARIAKVEELGRPLRVKLGIDPTAPDIHLGHTVVLTKLREFQDAGHLVVLIIGDYTARIGDPTGRTKTRPELDAEEIDRNAKTFQDQAFHVLDRDRVEVRYNSEWLDMNMEAMFKLLRIPTVAQLMERDDFANRFASGDPIALLELLYPVLQAYDSVAVNADVELGGTDQKFNLLLGRDVQAAFGQPPQVVLTMPILPGTDGFRRMGKSLGNHIGVSEAPEEIFGKTMSVPDDAMALYYDLLLGHEPDAAVPPVARKRLLARTIVDRYHGVGAGLTAESQFDLVHKDRQIPADIPVFKVSPGDSETVHLPALISEAFGESRGQARRLIEQGGVQIDGVAVPRDQLDIAASSLNGVVLQLGKRRFCRLQFDFPL